MKRDIVVVILALVIIALWSRSVQQKSSWVDIIALWKPVASDRSSTYRFWLDGEHERLQITAKRYPEMCCSRSWSLEVSRGVKEGSLPVPQRTENSPEGADSVPDDPDALIRFDTSASTEWSFFAEPVPEIYFRPHNGAYQFMVRGVGKDRSYYVWRGEREWVLLD